MFLHQKWLRNKISIQQSKKNRFLLKYVGPRVVLRPETSLFNRTFTSQHGSGPYRGSRSRWKELVLCHFLNCNSVCTFRPVFLLIQDLELKPWASQFFRKKPTERPTLLSLILMSTQWLRAKSSTWSSKRLFTITTICSSPLNPGSTLTRLITTFKFQYMSFFYNNNYNNWSYNDKTLYHIIIGHKMTAA